MVLTTATYFDRELEDVRVGVDVRRALLQIVVLDEVLRGRERDRLLCELHGVQPVANVFDLRRGEEQAHLPGVKRPYPP